MVKEHMLPPKVRSKTRMSSLPTSINIVLDVGHFDPCESINKIKDYSQEFPGGPVVKNPSCNAGDTGSIPWSGK